MHQWHAIQDMYHYFVIDFLLIFFFVSWRFHILSMHTVQHCSVYLSLSHSFRILTAERELSLPMPVRSRRIFSVFVIHFSLEPSHKFEISVHLLNEYIFRLYIVVLAKTYIAIMAAVLWHSLLSMVQDFLFDFLLNLFIFVNVSTTVMVWCWYHFYRLYVIVCIVTVTFWFLLAFCNIL